MIDRKREIHLEALHQALNLSTADKLDIRQKKERILEHVGFSKGENVAIRKEFNLPSKDDKGDGVKQHLQEQLGSGRFIAMLFKDGKWESMGGAPVTYIHNESDLNSLLVFEDDRLITATSHSGELLNIDHPVRLQTFSRIRSMKTNVSGLINYEGEQKVALGGGFRLQVDGIEKVEDGYQLIVSSEFSFNDMGSRVLSLSCKQDQEVPRFNKIYKIPIVDGKLEFKNDNNQPIEAITKADEVADVIVSSLFKKDGEAVNRLVKALLTTRPIMNVHQLEGIFSIIDDQTVSAEVIDFDGIDISDMEGISIDLGIQEQFINHDLNNAGILINDPKVLLEYSEYKAGVRSQIDQILESTDLPQDAKDDLEKVFKVNNYEFPRDMTENIKLGRLLNLLDINWDSTSLENIKVIESDHGKLFLISINGFNIGYLANGDKVVEIDDLKDQVSLIEKITNRQIVTVHLSSLREGD